MASTTSGTVDFVVGEETFQTWYKIVGDLRQGVRPLVILHGGPGIPHLYITAHETLHESYGIPVVFYDQLGAGASTHLRDKPGSFWTVELFMDELENLVAKLGIVGGFDLLGHSWGGMLASTWASRRHPAGLRRLVIADSPASMALWETSCRMLIEKLPSEVKDVLNKHEREGTMDSPEYQAALEVFYGKHVCRRQPFPEEVLAAFAELEKDPTVYHTMNGPNEFVITGSLRTWSVLDTLHEISQPTLLINGRHDEAQDVCVSPFFERIPKVKWVQFGESSHMPFVEERERYFGLVAGFLNS